MNPKTEVQSGAGGRGEEREVKITRMLWRNHSPFRYRAVDDDTVGDFVGVQSLMNESAEHEAKIGSLGWNTTE